MFNICRGYILQKIIHMVESQYAELRNSEKKKKEVGKTQTLTRHDTIYIND